MQMPMPLPTSPLRPARLALAAVLAALLGMPVAPAMAQISLGGGGVRGLIDTGASLLSLSGNQAKAMGLRFEALLDQEKHLFADEISEAQFGPAVASVLGEVIPAFDLLGEDPIVVVAW